MKTEIIQELLSLGEEQKTEIIDSYIASGVLIPIRDGVFIGKDVCIEKGAVILPGSVLTGETKIGEGAVIGPDTWLSNVTVGKGTQLNNVQGVDSTVGEGCDIGPYVQIRPDCRVGDKVHLGNFVEVKNSTIDEGTKVSHLTYVGDSDVGKNCNFGCGTVTVNYDGKNKHRTKIGNYCFIGCNTNLISPVTLGDFAYTAAGSTITSDVPESSLAIARARQVNSVDWVLRKKPYKVNPQEKEK